MRWVLRPWWSIRWRTGAVSLLRSRSPPGAPPPSRYHSSRRTAPCGIASPAHRGPDRRRIEVTCPRRGAACLACGSQDKRPFRMREPFHVLAARSRAAERHCLQHAARDCIVRSWPCRSPSGACRRRCGTSWLPAPHRSVSPCRNSCAASSSGSRPDRLRKHGFNRFASERRQRRPESGLPAFCAPVTRTGRDGRRRCVHDRGGAGRRGASGYLGGSRNLPFTSGGPRAGAGRGVS